jgi:hypothetical protein
MGSDPRAATALDPIPRYHFQRTNGVPVSAVPSRRHPREVNMPTARITRRIPPTRRLFPLSTSSPARPLPHHQSTTQPPSQPLLTTAPPPPILHGRLRRRRLPGRRRVRRVQPTPVQRRVRHRRHLRRPAPALHRHVLPRLHPRRSPRPDSSPAVVASASAGQAVPRPCSAVSTSAAAAQLTPGAARGAELLSGAVQLGRRAAGPAHVRHAGGVPWLAVLLGPASPLNVLRPRLLEAVHARAGLPLRPLRRVRGAADRGGLRRGPRLRQQEGRRRGRRRRRGPAAGHRDRPVALRRRGDRPEQCDQTRIITSFSIFLPVLMLLTVN